MCGRGPRAVFWAVSSSQRKFLCEGGYLLANATAVAYTRAYGYRHNGTTVPVRCDSTALTCRLAREGSFLIF